MDPRDLASANPKDDRMNGFSGLADANPRMTMRENTKPKDDSKRKKF